jgi:integrase
MNKPLTDLLIKNRGPSGKREEVPDGKVGGLYLVIQPSGAKSWAVRYRFAGRPKKFTIGAYPGIDLATARKRAQEALGKAAGAIDPAAEKKVAKAAAKALATPSKGLVEKVVEEFIERHAKPNTRDWRETERILKKDVVGAWKDRRLADIGKADVHRLLDAIKDRGAPVGANRTFAQLRKMCRWAVSRGIIDRNFCEGIERPSAESTRDRVLDEGELAIIWNASRGLGFPFGPIVRLLVLTGQRRNEVGGMRWSELDLDAATWTIPSERSKNHRQHVVPLSRQAIAELRALPRFAGSEFVFSPGKMAPSGYSHAKVRLDKEILTGPDGIDAEAPPAWTIHDIRRSVASGLARLGVDLHIIERCLNHVSGSFGGIVSVYQKHRYESEMRRALEAWGGYVERLVSGETPSNVRELASARS